MINNKIPCNYIANLNKAILNKDLLWIIDSKLSNDFKIIEFELILNYFILNLIDKLEIDQVNWKGKHIQHLIYN